MKYVVITPARNERDYIGATLDSMIAQTQRPLRWVIVSDGSTDGTDELVDTYQARYDWIELVRLPTHRNRNFASKVEGFNAGFARVRELSYDVVASLDADIAFGPSYFEFLLQRLNADPRLGVAGTPFVEGNRQYDYRFTNIHHVSGACQVFRRQCFEEIGGYVPIKGGGIDWVAVTTARWKGWHTRTFTDMTCQHLRPIGMATKSRFTVAFHQGKKDYALGGHPIWQLFRSIRQATQHPYVFGGASLFAGYVWAWVRQVERPVSPGLMRFHRDEQMQRLRTFFHRAAGTLDSGVLK